MRILELHVIDSSTKKNVVDLRVRTIVYSRLPVDARAEKCSSVFALLTEPLRLAMCLRREQLSANAAITVQNDNLTLNSVKKDQSKLKRILIQFISQVWVTNHR